jgi:hypothetical protein
MARTRGETMTLTDWSGDVITPESLPEFGETPRTMIDSLVEVALEDIELGNLEVRGALRIIATIAWREGKKTRYASS